MRPRTASIAKIIDFAQIGTWRPAIRYPKKKNIPMLMKTKTSPEILLFLMFLFEVYFLDKLECMSIISMTFRDITFLLRSSVIFISFLLLPMILVLLNSGPYYLLYLTNFCPDPPGSSFHTPVHHIQSNHLLTPKIA